MLFKFSYITLPILQRYSKILTYHSKSFLQLSTLTGQLASRKNCDPHNFIVFRHTIEQSKTIAGCRLCNKTIYSQLSKYH